MAAVREELLVELDVEDRVRSPLPAGDGGPPEAGGQQLQRQRALQEVVPAQVDLERVGQALGLRLDRGQEPGARRLGGEQPAEERAGPVPQAQAQGVGPPAGTAPAGWVSLDPVEDQAFLVARGDAVHPAEVVEVEEPEQRGLRVPTGRVPDRERAPDRREVTRREPRSAVVGEERRDRPAGPLEPATGPPIPPEAAGPPPRATDHVEDGLPGTEVSDCGRVPSQRAHPGGAVWAPAAWRIKRAAPILPARCELDSCRRGAWRSPSSPCWARSSGSCSSPRARACRCARRSSRGPRAGSRPPSLSRVARAAGAPRCSGSTLAATDPRALAAEELQLFLSSRDAAGRSRLRGAAGPGLGVRLHRKRAGRDRSRPAHRLPPLTRLLASGDAAPGTALDLAVEVKGSGDLALLGFEPLAGAVPGPIQAPPLGARRAAARRARRLRPLPGDGPTDRPSQPHVAPLSRDRLARGGGVRRHRPGPRGLPGVPDASARRRVDFSRRRRGRARGGGAALLAASLAVLYAVLAPPLSGPDEPYHLLGYADLTKDVALAEDAVAWMAETHLWRIRYNPEEHFRTIDVGQPFVVADPQLRPTEVAQRSAVLARLERAVAPLLRGLPAPRVLLALRLLNALLFALAVGVATALAVALVPEPLPQWLAFPFLFVPSLPFFAMHVSETALLCSIYVLLAISLAVLFGDGPGSHWAGVPLGLATGLMLAGGRSPWPLTALVAAALLGRAVLGPSGSRRARRRCARLLGGLRPRRGRLLRPAGRRLPLDDGALRPPLRALHPLRPAVPSASGSSAARRPRRASSPSAWRWRSRRARCAPGSPPGWSGGRGSSCGGRRSGSSRWSSSPSSPRCSFRFPSSRSSRSTR